MRLSGGSFVRLNERVSKASAPIIRDLNLVPKYSKSRQPIEQADVIITEWDKT